MNNYTLYGSQASLFTGKARGYMQWKGVDFDEVAVTSDIMKNVILPHVGWPVVPVVRSPDGRIIQDTVDIIADIEAAFPEPSVMPNRALQRFVSHLLQLYGDEWLLLPAMHYRWNYNEEWIYSEFGRSGAADASPEEQYEIGKKRGQMFKGFVPLLGISSETIPGIEASYEAFLAEFSAHLEHHPFIFGQRPSLADFSLLGPLYAHLYRDPASGEIMKRLAPLVAAWTERTVVGEGMGSELLDDDVIPATLEPILSRSFEEHLPVLKATNTLLASWASDKSAGTEVPRTFDMVPFAVGGRSGNTMSRTFSLFRLQAALDAYADLNPADRARADALLSRVGGEDLSTFRMARRLGRRNFKVVLAD